jgi:putative transcriptional regulator
MEQALFDDLIQSLKEAKAISHGEAPASRRIKVMTPDVKMVREQIGLSQREFAELIQVSIKTLQNWEQHRRNPTGPAAVLLKIVLTAPDLALKTLHTSIDEMATPSLNAKIHKTN